MTHDSLKNLWTKQRELNELFRPGGPPTSYAERTALTKEMVLHLISETDELLRVSGAWKPHRNLDVRENRPAIGFELADILKYWITIAQIWGFTPEEALDYFAKKDMIVRQRHSEEFVKSVDRPSVLVDLDGVLANYVDGFLTFMRGHGVPQYVLDTLRDSGWIDKTSFEEWIPEDRYDELRHDFRCRGGFGMLPMLPGARSFMDWLHEQDYYTIILTSRPIHQYPNIYSDTIMWLDQHELHYDFIWWGQDKGNVIEDRNVRKHIQFAVDDDLKFAVQLAKLGISVYWIHNGKESVPALHAHKIKPCTNLTEMLQCTQHGEKA